MFSELCLRIIENEGIKLDIKKRSEIKDYIQKCFNEDRFLFIKKSNKSIGFLTFEVIKDKVFMSNLCILRKHRSKNNLLSLRKLFKGNNIYWKNRKRGVEKCFSY